jgi:hypothetical protein
VSKNSLRWLLVSLLYGLVAFGRIVSSFGKLASDPGYDFLLIVEKDGLKSLFSGSEGYIQIGPRLLAMFARLFPIEQQAVVLSASVTIVVIMIALLIFQAVFTQFGKTFLAVIAGLAFLVVPAAAESTVGNYGSIKWPLVVGLAVVIACQKFVEANVLFTVALVIFVGLCSPLAIAVSLPLLGYALPKFGQVDKSLKYLLAAAVGVTLVQFLYWYSSGAGAQIYGGSVPYKPWAGMGLFWYSIWLTPPLFGLLVLIIFLVLKFATKASVDSTAIWLALSAMGIFAATYMSTGIKDSTAVAGQSLAWISVIITMFVVIPTIPFHFVRIGTTVALSMFFVVSSVKWYSASWYLVDGKKWSVLIEQARTDCADENAQTAKLQLLLAETELDCDKFSLRD